jgi:hypothetical protein
MQWCIIGFGIGHTFSIGQIKQIKYKKLNTFVIGLDGEFQAMFSKYCTQIFVDQFNFTWRFVADTKVVIYVLTKIIAVFRRNLKNPRTYYCTVDFAAV